ncbi:FlgN protein [Tumebacillus sp. BK434]|uniref:flagellar protein FlgN n=1 Tax=Tumebacillus sp. BK434 TaxID=2512169 RepID=UPI001048FD1C|nr:flagellar protein FlgN [Tumebacillus sp. BK434]TCP57834.1 FlgN protein [Tumebacillus sp. BK434]
MNDLTPVVDVIKQMVAAYQELLKVQEQKRDALIAGRVDDLPDILQEELKAVAATQKLEAERQSALETAFGAAASGGDWTLEKLQSVAGPVHRLQVRAAGEALQQTVRQVQNLHELNKKLVGQSLQYVQNTLDLMAGENTMMTPTYGRPDASPYGDGSPRRMFDSKV